MKALFFILTLALITSCATVPYTSKELKEKFNNKTKEQILFGVGSPTSKEILPDKEVWFYKYSWTNTFTSGNMACNNQIYCPPPQVHIINNSCETVVAFIYERSKLYRTNCPYQRPYDFKKDFTWFGGKSPAQIESDEDYEKEVREAKAAEDIKRAAYEEEMKKK